MLLLHRCIDFQRPNLKHSFAFPGLIADAFLGERNNANADEKDTDDHCGFHRIACAL
jgi:hypothetical protein